MYADSEYGYNGGGIGSGDYCMRNVLRKRFVARAHTISTGRRTRAKGFSHHGHVPVVRVFRLPSHRRNRSINAIACASRHTHTLTTASVGQSPPRGCLGYTDLMRGRDIRKPRDVRPGPF